MPKFYKTSAIIVLLMAVLSAGAYAAEQAETERLLRRITPPLAIAEKEVGKKDEMYADVFYEPSDIMQGNKTGHWSELTERFGYSHGRVNGYMSVSELERFDDKDYTANIGSYFSFKDSYVHAEVGFGWKVSYIYKLQTIAEYGHKLIKDVFWQIGYSYRGYSGDDTHLIYPGLIYYFGDNYIGADYGVSFIESRDTAHIGTIKGDFAITKFIHLSGGVAFGERLYDIYGLNADEEFGYILFAGLNFNIYKGINCRVGYSYGTEDPKFIKRSLDFGLSAKF